MIIFLNFDFYRSKVTTETEDRLSGKNYLASHFNWFNFTQITCLVIRFSLQENEKLKAIKTQLLW